MNYRDRFSNDRAKKERLIDIVRREKLFYEKEGKIIQSRTTDDYTANAESERFVKSFIKQKARYVPDIDYAEPSTFCFYGSAEKYYLDSIERVYLTYPYDGSRAEKMEWTLTSSFLDLYMLEHEYPKTTGHVRFSQQGWGSAGSTSNGYANPQAHEYI